MSIQGDLKEYLRQAHMSRKDFAALVGVNVCALSRFLCNPGSSIAERVVPWLYGDKRALLFAPRKGSLPVQAQPSTGDRGNAQEPGQAGQRPARHGEKPESFSPSLAPATGRCSDVDTGLKPGFNPALGHGPNPDPNSGPNPDPNSGPNSGPITGPTTGANPGPNPDLKTALGTGLDFELGTGLNPEPGAALNPTLVANPCRENALPAVGSTRAGVGDEPRGPRLRLSGERPQNRVSEEGKDHV